MNRIIYTSFFNLLLLSFSVESLERITGYVKVLEPTYMPNTISFSMSAGTASCPAGSWLKWSKTEDNNKVAFSTLMAALMSGKKINLYFLDNDTTCTAQFLHLLSE
ncbi:hypothetical protein Swoo_1472 [Shewanella woodyi ATCC 51908]|uniref:Uncharacterized protein n=2 Tax=Shewanella woodyi TaxID=60961 RepID=B1KKC0_SHEWM|nr:hypothetical protein Swoo_1472 [Shewanella woodyi ATCC 51908]